MSDFSGYCFHCDKRLPAQLPLDGRCPWCRKDATAPSLDRELGDLKLEDALERVDEATADGWKDRAFEAYEFAARRWPEFTNDQIWVILEDEWQTPPPKNRRALGQVARAAAKAGVMENTGRYVGSDRPHIHRSLMPVYRSLVYVDRTQTPVHEADFYE